VRLFPFLAILGCATRTCPPETRVRGEPQAMRAALSQIAAGPEAHVLVLSGGGSRGAWGAGILKGWRESGRRPRFDVVTGVSTGALLATHAFLGDVEDDEALETIYAGYVTNSDIFRERWLLEVPFSTSLTTLGPLEALIERTLPDQQIARVAMESGHRRLYVATTNLDAGLTKVWDMVSVAASKDYALYRKILLASSSVPFVHAPVYIRDVHHADGGVREQILLRAVMLALAGTRVHVHVVVNGKLSIDSACVQPNILDIALRSVEVLSASSAVSTLRESFAITGAAAGVWRLARIPDHASLGFDAMTFDPEGMKLLFDRGVQFGRAGNWENAPPNVADATRHLEFSTEGTTP